MILYSFPSEIASLNPQLCKLPVPPTVELALPGVKHSAHMCSWDSISSSANEKVMSVCHPASPPYPPKSLCLRVSADTGEQQHHLRRSLYLSWGTELQPLVENKHRHFSTAFVHPLHSMSNKTHTYLPDTAFSQGLISRELIDKKDLLFAQKRKKYNKW